MDDTTRAVRKLQRDRPVDKVKLTCRGDAWIATAIPHAWFQTKMAGLDPRWSATMAMGEGFEIIQSQVYGMGRGATPTEAVEAITPNERAETIRAQRSDTTGGE